MGKRGAREILEGAAASGGGRLVDVRLPNLGEHGRPNYNSFVATFVAAVRDGHDPQVADRPVGLLHAQGAAQAPSIDGLATDAHRIDPAVTTVGVQQVLDLLHDFKRSYDQGEFPDLSSQFRIELFNTYRGGALPRPLPDRLGPSYRSPGTFVETVRCRGGEGQTSFSTTVPVGSPAASTIT